MINGDPLNSWTSDGVILNGINQYVQVPTDDYGLNDAMTVVASVYIDRDDHGRIISKHDFDHGWMLTRHFGSDSFEWRISTNGNDWNGGFTSTNSFPVGQWIHIAAAYDGSQMKVFINGIEDSGGDFPVNLSGSINNSSAKLQIGRDEGSGSAAQKIFKGTIGQVRLYNRALGASDIEVIYNNLP